jgi:hypothetical protein
MQNLRSLVLNSGCTFEHNVKKRDDPEIRLIKLGLRVPKKDSYQSFVVAIKTSENEFKKLSILNGIVKTFRAYH